MKTLLKDRVLIRIHQKTTPIIHQSDTMYLQGEIINRGEMKYDDLSVGDKVLFGRFAGMPHGNDSKIVRETDIIAKIEEWI